MITILHRGVGGSLGTPKSDYVICARPLIKIITFPQLPRIPSKQNEEYCKSIINHNDDDHRKFIMHHLSGPPSSLVQKVALTKDEI